MVVKLNWHVTFERESVRMPVTGSALCVLVLCVCLCVCVWGTDRDVMSSKRTMRLVQGWTLGDGGRQRDGAIGGRRWRRTRGQWVTLFVSPPAPSMSEGQVKCSHCSVVGEVFTHHRLHSSSVCGFQPETQRRSQEFVSASLQTMELQWTVTSCEHSGILQLTVKNLSTCFHDLHWTPCMWGESPNPFVQTSSRVYV